MTYADAAAMLDAMMPTEAEVLAMLDAVPSEAEVVAMLDAVVGAEATEGYAEATVRPR